MKQFARRIDKLRINHSNYEYFISLEYLMEWMFSIIYWSWLRVFVAYHIQSGSEFFVVIMMHFLMEIFESNIKFTTLYFKTSSNALDWIHDEVYWIWRHFEDNSDKNEWRGRLSMDMICRFFASFLTGIFEIFYILLQGKNWYDNHYGNSSNSYWTSIRHIPIY